MHKVMHTHAQDNYPVKQCDAAMVWIAAQVPANNAAILSLQRRIAGTLTAGSRFLRTVHGKLPCARSARGVARDMSMSRAACLALRLASST
mmetsp:Transcript_92844/g.179018  ORF Transcript_92844/g.179018 Transcript_92844/m.179018 type:complete len:91 (-) Transcript_92844:808-1080(-)